MDTKLYGNARLTGAQWELVINPPTRIHDVDDGWTNGACFHSTPITYEEYMKRRSRCTVRHDPQPRYAVNLAKLPVYRGVTVRTLSGSVYGLTIMGPSGDGWVMVLLNSSNPILPSGAYTIRDTIVYGVPMVIGRATTNLVVDVDRS